MPYHYINCRTYAMKTKSQPNHSTAQYDARKQECINELRAKLRAKRRSQLEALVRTHKEKKT